MFFFYLAYHGQYIHRKIPQKKIAAVDLVVEECYSTSVCICTLIIRMMCCHLDRFIQPCLSRDSSSSSKDSPEGTASRIKHLHPRPARRPCWSSSPKAIRELNSLWCCCGAGEDETVPLGLILMLSSTCFRWRLLTNEKSHALGFVSFCHRLDTLAFNSSVLALWSGELSPPHMWEMRTLSN